MMEQANYYHRLMLKEGEKVLKAINDNDLDLAKEHREKMAEYKELYAQELMKLSK